MKDQLNCPPADSLLIPEQGSFPVLYSMYVLILGTDYRIVPACHCGEEQKKGRAQVLELAKL